MKSLVAKGADMRTAARIILSEYNSYCDPLTMKMMKAQDLADTINLAAGGEVTH
jgi:hypothetical protein